MTLPTLKVFISSPGDLMPERELARQVIERMTLEFRPHFHIEAVWWEWQALLATDHPQQQLLNPADSDVFILLLSQKMGTPIPSAIGRGAITGNEVTGTEYEFEAALKGYRDASRPAILAYLKKLPDGMTREPALAAFIGRWLQGNAYRSFDSDAKLEAMLERHLRRLLQQTLQQRHGRDIRWTRGNPFRGLQAFEPDYQPVFFGRDAARQDLRERLRQRAVQGQALLIVLGASGSGKSSLVKAGLIPDLVAGLAPEARPCRYAITRPGATLDEANSNLQQALNQPDPSGKLLLLVDQWEEFYTRSDRSTSGETYIRQLQTLAESGTVWVVLTLRNDFFPALQADPLLFQEDSLYYIKPLSENEREQVIVRPADEAGLVFERHPVTHEPLSTVIRTAARAPDALPLLAFTLAQLYERRSEEGQLTYAAYESLGGLEGAIGHHADATFSALPADIQAALPALTRRLVTFGRPDDPDAQDTATARIAPLSAFADGTPQRQLLDALLAARLLVADQGHVRVAHEALLSRWEALAKQIRKDQQDLKRVARLEQDAALWREAGEKDQAGLLLPPGLRLAVAEDVLERWQRDLDDGIIAFIEASNRAEKRRRARAKQRLWQARLVATVAGVLALVAIVSGYLAKKQSDSFKTISVLSNAIIADDPTVKALILADLYEADEPPNGVKIAKNILDSTLAKEILRGHDGIVYAVAFSPDGKTIASAGHDKTIYLWDALHPGMVQSSLLNHTTRVLAIAFSPDSRWLASADGEGKIILQNLVDKQLKPTVLAGHNPETWSVAFHPNQPILASAGLDKKIIIWDIKNPEKPIKIADLDHKSWIINIAFSPDGQRLAVATWDGSVGLWDTSKIYTMSSASEYKELSGHTKQVIAVVFSPDGTRLASAGYDMKIKLWNMRQLDEEPLILEGHTGWVRALAFNPAGNRLASAGADRTIRLWDLDALDSEPHILRGHQDWVRGLAFSPDGVKLVSGSSDRTVRLWDVEEFDIKQTLLDKTDNWVSAIAYDTDGKKIALAGWHNKIRLWDLAEKNDNKLKILDGHQERIMALALSPDNQQLASASWDGALLLRDINNPSEYQVIDNTGKSIDSIAFSSNGKWLAYAGHDQKIRLWDTEKKAILLLGQHNGIVNDIAFTPDDKLLSISTDHTIRLWDINIAETPSKTWKIPDVELMSVAINPVQNLFAIAGNDGSVRVYDINQPALEPKILKGHGDKFIKDVLFSNDGKMLITASNGNYKNLLIWDVNNLQVEPFVLEGHKNGVLAIAVNVHDNLISSGYDNTVRLWDLSAIRAELNNRYLAHKQTWQELIGRLVQSTHACLLPRQRIEYLYESPTDARANYEACEHRHGRTPLSDDLLQE